MAEGDDRLPGSLKLLSEFCGENWDIWALKFRLVVEDLPDNKKRLALILKTGGKAEAFVADQGEGLHFDELWEKLDRRFGKKDCQIDAAARFEKRQLRTGESVRDYCDAMMRLSREAFPYMAPEQREQHVLLALLARDKNELRQLQFSMQPPASLEQYLGMVEKMQGLQIGNVGDGTREKERRPREATGPVRNRETKCFRCQKVGHIAKYCREKVGGKEETTEVKQEKKEIVCFRCQKPGHIAKMCSEN